MAVFLNRAMGMRAVIYVLLALLCCHAPARSNESYNKDEALGQARLALHHNEEGGYGAHQNQNPGVWPHHPLHVPVQKPYLSPMENCFVVAGTLAVLLPILFVCMA